MHGSIIVVALLMLGACAKSPEQKQVDEIQNEAQQRAAAIREQATGQAARLEDRAKGLAEKAKQAGGYTGERIDIHADALKKEARVVRKQGNEQAEALTESADARIKALKSR